MTKKKEKIFTVSEVEALIKEIKTKYRPDFITINDKAGEIHLQFPKGISQISVSFGWYIDKPQKKGSK